MNQSGLPGLSMLLSWGLALPLAGLGGCLSAITGCSQAEMSDKQFAQQTERFTQRVDALADALKQSGVSGVAIVEVEGEGEAYIKNAAGVDTGIRAMVVLQGNAQSANAAPAPVVPVP